MWGALFGRSVNKNSGAENSIPEQGVQNTVAVNEVEFTRGGFGVKKYAPQNIDKMYDLVQKLNKQRPRKQ